MKDEEFQSEDNFFEAMHMMLLIEEERNYNETHDDCEYCPDYVNRILDDAYISSEESEGFYSYYGDSFKED